MPSEWLKTMLSAGFGAGVTAVVTALSWRAQRHLQDRLAGRTRRADYLRGQIEHLYGPLAFLVESSECLITTSNSILKAYTENPSGRSDSEKRDGAIDTANRYVELVVENNKEAMKVLRTGWGWLDHDDILDAAQYLTDVHRHTVEFAEGHKLPFDFYIEELCPSGPGTPSFIRPRFIERIRTGLRRKQAELTGLADAKGSV
jgi:hypothetical protein